MPWDHCAHTGLSDVTPCPTCGVTKQAWTIQWNQTRTFRLGRRPMLRLELTDVREAPVSGEPVLVERADGSTVEATLDEAGCASVPAPGDGACRVTFPERRPGEVRPLADDEEAGEGAAGEGAAGEGAAGDGPAGEEPATDGDGPPPSFEVAPGRRARFRLDGVLTEFKLVAPDDLDLSSTPWSVELGDGRRFEGQLGARRSVRVVSPEGVEVRLELALEAHHTAEGAEPVADDAAEEEEGEAAEPQDDEAAAGGEGDAGEADDEAGSAEASGAGGGEAEGEEDAPPPWAEPEGGEYDLDDLDDLLERDRAALEAAT